MSESSHTVGKSSSSIDHVNLDACVYELMVSHVLTNDKEENMGLLIGTVQDLSQSNELFIVNVRALMILERNDKRQDRVEISPEQLFNATECSEKLSKQTDSSMQIIGWYHSHPNITVWPSHVDIKTQSMYQRMDKNFIGLIISVFNTNKTTNMNSTELICFQAATNETKTTSDIDYEQQFNQIPVKVVVASSPSPLIETILNEHCRIPNILIKEEQFSSSSTSDQNLFSLMSNLGIYLHSTSRIIDITFLQTIDSLKCREIINRLLLNFNEFYSKSI